MADLSDTFSDLGVSWVVVVLVAGAFNGRF